MTDWTDKATNDVLSKHGYKKPANGPTHIRTFAHPEGHKIEIDRNMYKHTKGNGEVTRGHVSNLPVAMRQIHPDKIREAELDIYNSKRKDAADDKMTGKGITARFKNDTAFGKGDWGNTQKKYAPGPTYEEDKMTENFQLLRAVLVEAQSFDPQDTEHTEDPITACSVCGVKGHVPAKHFGRALGGENNIGTKTKTYKTKKLLFGDEKTPIKEGMKFSRQHDTPEAAEKHKTSLEKQGVKAWVNHSQDGTHHTFWMQEDEQKVQQSIDEAKKKKWDKIAHVAAIARSTIGPIKKGQVITPKKDRKEKYKVNYMKEEGEESKHAYAARKHDEAAEHAGSEGRVIDRPYKDAVRASENTKHPRINEYIRNTSAKWGGDPIPHAGGRKAWHTKLAQMHRDADKE
jgi:hypothetical protein